MENINFEKTDGGKIGAGFTKEKNDCSVRALSIFFDVDYEMAHSVCKKFGRVNKKGMYSSQIKRAIKSLARSTGKNPVQVARSGSVLKVIKKYPHDDLMFFIRGHFFTVKASIIKDTWKPSENCHVKNAWILKREENFINDFCI